MSGDPEGEYLNLIKKVLKEGHLKEDRTGTGTLSIFGPQLRFSLSGTTFPLLTTKKMFFSGILKELLWFISGKTDSKLLSAQNVKIWDLNGSKSNLDTLGFKDRREGDLGPVYGFQWRHSGADYVNCDTDYSGKGIDQLLNVINLIKKDPNSRRILMSSWNPSQIPLMALPPCHVMCQFFVRETNEGGKLTCIMYQRSGDIGLGIPFNIASYALLTKMIAMVCGLEAEELIINIGDAHVYLNHVDSLKEQITREPYNFPKLEIKKKENIGDFIFSDFQISEYKYHPEIKMPMSV